MLKKMETINILATIIGFILMMIGVIMIYDARKLTQKWFSFGDRNEGVKWLKIGGFLLDIIGILILYFAF